MDSGTDSLNEVAQGRLKENRATYAFFLDVKKAYDTVWHDGLWLKLWSMGARGRGEECGR